MRLGYDINHKLYAKASCADLYLVGILYKSDWVRFNVSTSNLTWDFMYISEIKAVLNLLVWDCFSFCVSATKGDGAWSW